MPDLEQTSAFGTVAGGAPARTVCRRDVVVTERPGLVMVQLQRFPGREPHAEAGLRESTAGLAAWDLAPNTTRGADPIVFWMSPVERLIVSQSQPAAALLGSLAAERQPHRAVATDVSQALVSLRIAGDGAVEALAADVSVDLEGSDMAPGRCARTLFARLPALLHRPEAEQIFDLYVDRPVAVFVRDWLVRCAGGAL